MFEKMIQIAKNMKVIYLKIDFLIEIFIQGTQWETNMKNPKNREFYEWVEQALENYFASKNL